MKALDLIFKIGLLIIGVVFVAVYFLSSQNGRYVNFPKGDDSYTLLDTQAGIIYKTVPLLDKRVIILRTDLINGKFTSSTLTKEEPGK